MKVFNIPKDLGIIIKKLINKTDRIIINNNIKRFYIKSNSIKIKISLKLIIDFKK